jgi:hypothetical protein
MNEQVKILWAKAAESNFGDSWEEQTAFMSKFAELIVQECIEQVITGPNGPAHYAVEAALRLKKHFGVEQ